MGGVKQKKLFKIEQLFEVSGGFEPPWMVLQTTA